MAYQIHPDAALFPLMSDAEFAELVADIKANGLAQPIMLDTPGAALIDGRNRERACEKAGVEPRYDRLPEGVDVFTYIVSVNLHRRHLTGAQKTEIVKQVIVRNPDKSNREVARIARVSEFTIRKHRSTASNIAVESKTVGADGKTRPIGGAISPEKKAAIVASLKANPYGQKEIAEKHGVSVGTVAGIKRKLREAKGLHPKPVQHLPTLAEQAEMRRRNLKPFDSMTREEKGMGTKEYGAEQHPDYPPGWTRDDAFRVENGRINLFTPDEKVTRATIGKCNQILGQMAKLERALAEISTDDIARLSPKDREPFEYHARKLAPLIQAEIERLLDRQPVNLSIVR